VAQALAFSYAIGRGLSVPVKEAIDEEIDWAEGVMQSKLLGVVEADDEQHAVQQVLLIKRAENLVVPRMADRRVVAIPLSKLFKFDCTAVEVA
jgi:hypothetical protein